MMFTSVQTQKCAGATRTSAVVPNADIGDDVLQTSTSPAKMIQSNGQQKYNAAGCVLIKRWNVHQTHAVIEASHQQCANKGPEHPAAPPGQSSADDDSSGDSV